MSAIHTIHHRTCARVAVVMALSLLASAGPRVTAQAPAKAGSQAGHGGGSRRRRVAAGQHDAERRRARRLSAADRELAGSEERGPVRGGVLHAERRSQAGARHRQGGIRHERRDGSPARELFGVPDHRIELRHAAAGSGPHPGRGAHRRRTAQRARDRARSGARQRRHEPDHSQEHRRA